LPHEAGQLLGVNSAIGSLMNIFGPLFAGFIYDYFMVGSPFWVGALILFLTAYLLFRTIPGEAKRENLQAISP
ncbi:MAG TPA: hypothetical protein PK530_12610, partial [Anaerolineales bacterium]|nr:hypothetical protein [Anaerolineales bacterium]